MTNCGPSFVAGPRPSGSEWAPSFSASRKISGIRINIPGLGFAIYRRGEARLVFTSAESAERCGCSLPSNRTRFFISV